MLKFIVDNIKSGTISSKQAKEVFLKVIEEKKEPQNYISKENAQISDESELEKVIDENGYIITEKDSARKNCWI